MDWLVDHNLMPLASIFVEPAKVLFLNNAINHGVFTPLGIDQAAEQGKSVLFLVEANPGPGLGLLLAFTFFGKGIAKASAPGAIDHPVLRRHPRDLLPLRADEAEADPRHDPRRHDRRRDQLALRHRPPRAGGPGLDHRGLAAGAGEQPLRRDAVGGPRRRGRTFLVAAFLLKIEKDDDEGDLAAATASMEAHEGQEVASPSLGAGPAATPARSASIVFACDAGMGSSAMGASVLRKKIQARRAPRGHGRQQGDLQPRRHVDLVVTHQDLTDRAKQKTPSAIHVSVDNFMASPKYDEIVELIDRRTDGGAGRPEKRGRGQQPPTVTCWPGSRSCSAAGRGPATTRSPRPATCWSRRARSTPTYVDAMHERETVGVHGDGQQPGHPARHQRGQGADPPHRDLVRPLRRADRLERQAGRVRASASPVRATTTWRCCRGSRRRSPTRTPVARLRAAATPDDVLAVLDVVRV